jgi:hypothetical protein
VDNRLSAPIRERPRIAAAVVNGLLVLLLPPALLVAGNLLFNSDSDYSVTVRASERSLLLPALSILVRMEMVLLPFAALAGWRTWVHAGDWRTGRRGWRGVAEAGACGLFVALAYLAPGIVTRPMDAPPYVIAYGGAALVLGLVAGLLLRTTGVLVLKFYPSGD